MEGGGGERGVLDYLPDCSEDHSACWGGMGFGHRNGHMEGGLVIRSLFFHSYFPYSVFGAYSNGSQGGVYFLAFSKNSVFKFGCFFSFSRNVRFFSWIWKKPLSILEFDTLFRNWPFFLQKFLGVFLKSFFRLFFYIFLLFLSYFQKLAFLLLVFLGFFLSFYGVFLSFLGIFKNWHFQFWVFFRFIEISVFLLFSLSRISK